MEKQDRNILFSVCLAGRDDRNIFCNVCCAERDDRNIFCSVCCEERQDRNIFCSFYCAFWAHPDVNKSLEEINSAIKRQKRRILSVRNSQCETIVLRNHQGKGDIRG